MRMTSLARAQQLERDFSGDKSIAAIEVLADAYEEAGDRERSRHLRETARLSAHKQALSAMIEYDPAYSMWDIVDTMRLAHCTWRPGDLVVSDLRVDSLPACSS